jgi:hypothetical protein
MDDWKDAERYRRLKPLLDSADFSYLAGGVALIFRLPRTARIGADLDATLDALSIGD